MCIYIIFLSFLQSTFSVHASKKAEVSHMISVGDGVWISFKFDSTLRLFHGTTLTCMQDLDIGPSVQRILGENQCVLYVHVTDIVIRKCFNVKLFCLDKKFLLWKLFTWHAFVMNESIVTP